MVFCSGWPLQMFLRNCGIDVTYFNISSDHLVSMDRVRLLSRDVAIIPAWRADLESQSKQNLNNYAIIWCFFPTSKNDQWYRPVITLKLWRTEKYFHRDHLLSGVHRSRLFTSLDYGEVTDADLTWAFLKKWLYVFLCNRVAPLRRVNFAVISQLSA